MPADRIAEQWAAFSTNLAFDALPGAVVARIRQSLLDHLAAAVSGSRNHAVRLLLDYLASQRGEPQATVVAHGVRLPSRDAAMVNAAFVHCTELWEFFDRAAMPPNIVVPAVVLALAEREHTGGAEVLTALVAGYEISIRAGLAIRVDPLSTTLAAKPNDRPSGRDGPMGYYLSGATFGVYGATAAAARILRLDAAQTAHALTICSSLTPTIGLERSVAPEAAMPKDIYMACTANTAVTAAELAKRGFTGRADVTAHFAALVTDYEPELLTRGLGSEYLLSSGGLHPKLTAGSSYTQSAAAAAIELRRRDGFTSTDIERIDVHTGARAARKEDERSPANLVAARASLPYIVAAILVHTDAELAADPHLTQLYSDRYFDDPRRREVSQRVAVHGSQSYERALEIEWPQRAPARVTITLTSGAQVTVDADTSAFAAQLTDQDAAQKFRSLARGVLSESSSEQAIRLALSLELADSVDGLMAAVSAR